MLDLVYSQSYVMKWKHLEALLDMFDPKRVFLPDDSIIDEMIDLDYILFNEEQKTFYARHTYRAIIDLFLSYIGAVNIEAPKVKELGAALSMYFLPNHKHMLVLLQGDPDDTGENMVEIAVSDKSKPPQVVLRHIGESIIDSANENGKAENDFLNEEFDPQKLPTCYEKDYKNALTNGSIYRVTSLESNNSSNNNISVFASFPAESGCYWITTSRYKSKTDRNSINVWKVSCEEYKRALNSFFDGYVNEIWRDA